MQDVKNNETGNLVIVSVIGQDRVGIIAGVSTVLRDANVNILDISQTIMQGFFTMILVADLAASNIDLASLKERLTEVGEQLGVRIDVQHQDVFQYMHRI